jgi:hypothetical protein
VGVSVVAALQDPRKDVLGLRDLFPTESALRLDERTHVDMVVGDAVRELGADCDRISERTPGVGFVRTDGMREPMRVRASWISDGEIARIAAISARQAEDWTGLDEAASCPDLTRRFTRQPHPGFAGPINEVARSAHGDLERRLGQLRTLGPCRR